MGALAKMKYPLIWLVGLLIYGAFAFWFFNTGAPLSESEVRHHLAHFSALYPHSANSQTQIELRGVLAGDDGREIYTLHHLRMRAGAEPVEGLATKQKSVFDVFALWGEPALWHLSKRAGYVVFILPTLSDAFAAWGQAGGKENWTHLAMVRHRSRRDMMAFINDARVAKLQAVLPATIENHTALAAAPATRLLMTEPAAIAAWIILALTLLVHLAVRLQDKNYRR